MVCVQAECRFLPICWSMHRGLGWRSQSASWSLPSAAVCSAPNLRDNAVAWVRIFAPAGALGGLSGLLAPLARGPSLSIAVAFSASFVLFQLVHANDQDGSAMSTIGGLTVFGLAAYATPREPALSVSAAVVTTDFSPSRRRCTAGSGR
jgi:hypothetical protein